MDGETMEIPKLTDSASFPIWEYHMKMLFKSKNLETIANGKLTKQ